MARNIPLNQGLKYPLKYVGVYKIRTPIGVVVLNNFRIILISPMALRNLSANVMVINANIVAELDGKRERNYQYTTLTTIK